MSQFIEAGVNRVIDAVTDTLKDIIHCLSCRRKCEVTDAHEFRAKNGRLMITGICTQCGHKVTTFKRKRKCDDDSMGESCDGGCAEVVVDKQPEGEEEQKEPPPPRSSEEESGIDGASLAAVEAAAAAAPSNFSIFSEDIAPSSISDAQQ
jgi:hypothetical protein